MNDKLFEYRGHLYPDYLRRGNAAQHVIATAQHFCTGKGVDVGAGKWPFPGAVAVDVGRGNCDAYTLPPGPWDYVFSSHCLEHLTDPVLALEHWRANLAPGGVLFLYLPHPDMEYWRPQNCRKHRHLFYPADVARMLWDLGYVGVIHGERDLAWSFAVVGFNPEKT